MKKEHEALITKLLTEIENSPKGELERILRIRLWKMITENKNLNDQKQILTKLNIFCVQHGVGFWTKKFGDAQRIEHVLTVAFQAASGAIDEADAMAVRDDFYVSVVENESYEPDEYPAMFVGHAAANAIVTAVSDLQFDTDDQRDQDLDPEAFEPDYLVASAFAGGLSDDGDPELRRAFWRWYLSVAVPQVISDLP
ncbi:immunity protein Imm5 [Pseudomonas syringae]|uniref:Imm5 family immunity protein n=1 Tax=Pseudomonas syringae TaxID=317 RepID=UPI0018E634DE|nr:Imm5 family immunity protein [Pseudomonas syringae]MBI6763814.1 immunity protein Imm5 [Pseudomonas syringae]MBI6784736.1 immunity protein Imm5 [Pseudomonas syringae]MBI6796328.1 immunity protein Imm5 [Pseudomonas syringae]